MRAVLDARAGEGGRADGDLVAVVNTADDITLFGLRVSPDLDTVMYTLGGGSDEERGWGRSEETFTAKAELAAYGAQAGLVRARRPGPGDPHRADPDARRRFPALPGDRGAVPRWELGLRLLPMTDQRVETHIVVSDDEAAPAGARAMHFQEFWVRWHATLPVREVVLVGIDDTMPAPGVLDAIAAADVVLLAPSNPVVSVGPILAVPGIRAALRAAHRAGRRRLADHQRLAGAGHGRQAAAGDRGGDRCGGGRPAITDRGDAGGVLDGWLVDTSDAAALPALEAAGIAARAVPLFMHDVAASARDRGRCARARRRRRAGEVTGELSIIGVGGLPDVRPGDDLAALLAAAAADLRDGDIVVVTSKIVSKAEGRLVQADSREDAITAETVSVVAQRGPLADRPDPARPRARRGRGRRVERRAGDRAAAPGRPGRVGPGAAGRPGRPARRPAPR